MSVITATELAEKLRHAPQVMYADMVSLYVESILDEVEQQILYTEGAGSDDIQKIVADMKDQVNK